MKTDRVPHNNDGYEASLNSCTQQLCRTSLHLLCLSNLLSEELAGIDIPFQPEEAQDHRFFGSKAMLTQTDVCTIES
jgi:hypothetical protein